MRLNSWKIGRDELDKLWFTSDTHFGHANIIKYCKRPFGTAQHMDKTMIANWNSVVQPDHMIFHLGDFAFKEPYRIETILKQLNGRIHMINGNHDKNFDQDCVKLVERYWGDRVELKVDDPEIDEEHRQVIVLDHFPLESWHHAYHGAWHLHGHCHGTLPSSSRQARWDMGVDIHNFTPVSYREVKTHMTQKVALTARRGDRAPKFENEQGDENHHHT
jgi:calcineurin-like phosphoesterase family protein